MVQNTAVYTIPDFSAATDQLNREIPSRGRQQTGRWNQIDREKIDQNRVNQKLIKTEPK